MTPGSLYYIVQCPGVHLLGGHSTIVHRHLETLKADSQYNFLRRDMRLATHATSCDSDTRFTIFFMFATSSCTSSTMHVHCTCTQGRNCTPFVYVACHMSQKLNFLQLLRQVHCDSLRQLATARDRQFLVATVANRESRRRKLYCESALKRDSQKLFCDATRDATRSATDACDANSRNTIHRRSQRCDKFLQSLADLSTSP